MALADSGGKYTWGEFKGDTRANFIRGMSEFLCLAGWKLDSAVKATASGTPSTPVNGSTFSVGSLFYSFVTSINNNVARQVKVGATIHDSLVNLAEAINQDLSSIGSHYSRRTQANPWVTASVLANVITLTFKDGGPIGNLSSTVGAVTGGGYLLRGVSTQAQGDNPSLFIQVFCKVYDGGDASGGKSWARVKLYSTTDDMVTTGDKLLQVVAARRYQIVCNRMQFFVFVPGVAGNTDGSVVCGGIPFVPTASLCQNEVPAYPCNEAFWCSCDGGIGSTPRVTVAGNRHFSQTTTPDISQQISDSDGWFNSGGVFNGAASVNGNDGNIGHFRMVTMTASNHYDQNFGNTYPLVNATMWLGNKGMILEPLIAWGKTDKNGSPAIYGQLWDAWIKTSQFTMDTFDYIDGHVWLAFTNKCKLGTLLLRVPPKVVFIEDLQAHYAF